MSNETIRVYSTIVTGISGTTNLASNGFVGSAEVTMLTSASNFKYPTADAVFNGSFSTSLNSASAQIMLYRRDMNIDGTADAPLPQSSTPAYSNIQVGAFIVPPFSVGSVLATLIIPGVEMGDDCEFYIENRTNGTLLSGYSVKFRPKTFGPAP